jgi:predicted TIM-barrel fold metal-dependent hydrolase
MRVVALEEHFAVADLAARIDPARIAARGFPANRDPAVEAKRQAGLREIGPARIADMDQHGITMQILSPSGPGPDLLDPDDSIAWARDINDFLARLCREHPHRYGGFATLPMTAPEAAADELERAVKDLGFHGALINGTTQGLFLDDARFAPILARAESLEVPIYIHPGIPPIAVRDAYFQGLTAGQNIVLGGPGWGWHSETTIHILRLMASGTLDKFPALQIIIGHMGEMMAMFMDRFDDMFTPVCPDLKRSPSETIKHHLHITTSGIFTKTPFKAALKTFGIDRIMFSVDYPYSPHKQGADFLKELKLSSSDFKKLTHQNADKLLKLKKHD